MPHKEGGSLGLVTYETFPRTAAATASTSVTHCIVTYWASLILRREQNQRHTDPPILFPAGPTAFRCSLKEQLGRRPLGHLQLLRKTPLSQEGPSQLATRQAHPRPPSCPSPRDTAPATPLILGWFPPSHRLSSPRPSFTTCLRLPFFPSAVAVSLL